jgi:serine/threonine protein kinase
VGNDICVAKIVSESNSPDNDDEKKTRQKIQDLQKEIQFLSNLRYTGIVKFVGVILADKDLSSPILLIEKCNTTLEKRILASVHTDYNRRIPFSDASKVKIAYELSSALEYLHEYCIPIVHRDCKPANIFLNGNDDVKLADFGLARFVNSLPTVMPTRVMTGETGSYRYMAPEVYSHIPNYTCAVDIFSYSMVIYFMCSGKRPFPECTDAILAAKLVFEGKRPDLGIIKQKSLSNIICWGWNPNPQLRPCASDITNQLQVQYQGSIPSLSSTSSSNNGETSPFQKFWKTVSSPRLSFTKSM